MTIEYRYDEDDLRVSREMPGETPEYYFRDHAGGELAVYDYEEDRLKQLNLLGNGLEGKINVTWEYQGSGDWGGWFRYDHKYYYVKDHLGSIRATLDEEGGLMSARDYYPFGETLRSITLGDVGDRYQFTEKERDQETGLDYFGARYYNAMIGRFMTADPNASNYPGWSSFHYAANNPLIITDPTGRDWYLNLASGRVVWYDGSDDRFDQGYINLGTLDGQDDTTIEMITEQLDELGYDYAFTVDDGLTVDTKSQYQGWIMMQIFSPEHVGTALAFGTLGTLGTSTYSGIRSSPNIIHDGIKSTTHGTNRIAGATATRGGVLSQSEIAITNKVGRTFTQADGAIVKVHEVGGRYNVTVTGDKGLITTFKNLSPKSLEKLSRNYGWK